MSEKKNYLIEDEERQIVKENSGSFSASCIEFSISRRDLWYIQANIQHKGKTDIRSIYIYIVQWMKMNAFWIYSAICS